MLVPRAPPSQNKLAARKGCHGMQSGRKPNITTILHMTVGQMINSGANMHISLCMCIPCATSTINSFKKVFFFLILYLGAPLNRKSRENGIISSTWWCRSPGFTVFAVELQCLSNMSQCELVLQTGIYVNGVNSVCTEGTMSSSGTYLLTAISAG